MSTAAALSERETILERLVARADAALHEAVLPALARGTPPRLRDAIHHAVFAGGARLRPTLSLAVAVAHGDPNPPRSNAAAVAIELVHCASLVHDDLPCFDDAMLRRGQPTVHAAFGVPLAILAGDALIVLAFQVLAQRGAYECIGPLAEATGPARGIIGGQAWETEARIPVDEYHRAKTASLFQAAAVLGARTAGASSAAWADFGDRVGRAYQAADDVTDVVGCAADLGKPVGRDEALRRPSVVRSDGLSGARRHIRLLVDDAARAIPPCSAASAVRQWLDGLCAKMAASGVINTR